MLSDRIASRDVEIGRMFLSWTMIGILGNFSVLYHYLFLYHTGHKLRSPDLILKYLVIANILVILAKGIQKTMIAFGLKLSSMI